MAKGLSNNTVKKNKFLLNQFFDYAMECGLVQVNPTYKIKVRNREVKLSDKENYGIKITCKSNCWSYSA